MPDDRPLREKLEAMAADRSSPQEADVARVMLENMPGPQPRIKTRRILTREAVMAAPDRVSSARHEVAVRFPSGRWVQMYEDEANWELIKYFGLEVERFGKKV